MSSTKGWVIVTWMRLAWTHMGVMSVCATVGSLVMDSYDGQETTDHMRTSVTKTLRWNLICVHQEKINHGDNDLHHCNPFKSSLACSSYCWAALCSEVSGALTFLMACMLCVVYVSSLFRGFVSSCLPTASFCVSLECSLLWQPYAIESLANSI